jgi:hypothetical protein
VFRFGSEVEYYTDVVPACVEGLQRVTLGAGTPKPMREELTRFLIGRWQSYTKGDIDWGPLNVHYLVQALRDVAMARHTSEAHRSEIVKSLARHMIQESIMIAVTDVLAAVDKPGALATLAAAVMRKLLDRRDESGQFRDVERETVLWCLGRLVGRRYLATSSPQFQNLRKIVVDLLFEGLKDNVMGCHDRLIQLRDDSGLPARLKEDIATRLEAYHAVVATK